MRMMKSITDAKQRSEKMINVARKAYWSSRTDTDLETETLIIFGPCGSIRLSDGQYKSGHVN